MQSVDDVATVENPLPAKTGGDQEGWNTEIL
jgi:hypothetical protein